MLGYNAAAPVAQLEDAPIAVPHMGGRMGCRGFESRRG
jgi:hypothetical protein